MRRPHWLDVLLSVAAGVALSALCFGADVHASPLLIDTYSTWGGTGFSAARGGSVGQTISTPVDAVLSSFTFFVEDTDDVATFSAYIMPWEDFYPTNGAVLYESDTFQTTNNGGKGGMEPISFSPGMVLSANVEYLVFLSGTNQVGGVPSTLLFAFTGQDVYSGGQGTVTTAFELIGSNSWGSFDPPTNDFAFQAELRPVPEPASAVLLVSGIGVAAIAKFRRRRLSTSRE